MWGAYVSKRIKKYTRNPTSNTGWEKFLKINMNQDEFDDIIDNLIGVGFQDDDDFTSLEDAKFDYFSKYSDEQLDCIYEVDENAREIIDKIRKSRDLSRYWS